MNCGPSPAKKIPLSVRTVRHDATRGDHALGEPTATLALEVVVAHAAAARARVDDAPAPGVDRHVVDPRAVVREEQEVACAQRLEPLVGPPGDRLAEHRHLPRRARERHALPREDVLHEPGAVEPALRGRAAVGVGCADVPVGVVEHARQRPRAARRRRQRALGVPLGAHTA
jgi:hypothetical protein